MAVIKVKLNDGNVLSYALFTNVRNSVEIRKELMSGNLKCAVIKPCFIVDLFQVSVAASKAQLAESQKKLTTKSIYTEILFNLSLSKNISQSLLKFGIDDKDSDIFIVSFGDDAEVDNIISKIEGDLTDMDKLNTLMDEKLIRKTYKISESELGVSSLLNIVVSKLATKDFVNY